MCSANCTRRLSWASPTCFIDFSGTRNSRWQRLQTATTGIVPNHLITLTMATVCHRAAIGPWSKADFSTKNEWSPPKETASKPLSERSPVTSCDESASRTVHIAGAPRFTSRLRQLRGKGYRSCSSSGWSGVTPACVATSARFLCPPLSIPRPMQSLGNPLR